MATEVDPLRSTLDHLVVDPAAKADRPYLESMLRRLGYSEVEIQTYLGTAPTASTATPEPGDRLIELEYTGPGLRDYAFVTAPDTTTFGVDADGNPVDLGSGLTAGEEVIEGGPSMAEVDALMEQQDLSDFGDFAGLDSEVGKMNVVEGDEGFVEFGEPSTEGGEDLVEFGETPPGGGEDLVEFGETPALQVGEELIEFKANPVNIGYTTPLAAAVGAAGEQAPGDDTWAALDEGAPTGPFQYEDWTLYGRDVELADGRRQRVYFFSKGVPADGEASPMPEGYEVGLNDRTGLPFLQRQAEPVHPEELPQAFHPDAETKPAASGRKRVRMKRVRASNRAEAEEQVRQEGGDVLTSVPVDIKERWEP